MKRRPRKRRIRCIVRECRDLVNHKDVYQTKAGPVCKRCWESGATWRGDRLKTTANKIKDEDSE
jgi:hypothetical protein